MSRRMAMGDGVMTDERRDVYYRRERLVLFDTSRAVVVVCLRVVFLRLERERCVEAVWKSRQLSETRLKISPRAHRSTGKSLKKTTLKKFKALL